MDNKITAPTRSFSLPYRIRGAGGPGRRLPVDALTLTFSPLKTGSLLLCGDPSTLE